MSECVVCGSTDNLVRHHVSYEPEKMVSTSRHAKIHGDRDFRPDLTPDDSPYGTSIPIGEETRDRLRAEKVGGETYDDVIRRLLGDEDR